MVIEYKGNTYTFMGVAYGSNSHLIAKDLMPTKKKLIVVHDDKGEIHWLPAKKCVVKVNG